MSLTIRPTLRDAAQRALEALEVSTRFVYADLRPQCEEAITALRAALAEDVPPAPKELNEASLNELVEELKNLGSLGKFKPTHMLFDEKGLEYCKKLERDDPETNFGNIPQPVAYISGYHKGRCIIEAVDRNVLLPVGMALYRAPTMTGQESRQVEPVGYFSINSYGNWEQNESGCGTPLYEAPPKREPLTDAEIKRLYDSLPSKYTLAMFARAVERAHGIGGEE